MIPALALLFATPAFAQEAYLTIQQDIVVDEKINDYYAFEADKLGGSSKCALSVQSGSAVKLKAGTRLRGYFNAKEKEVWKDSDNIAKSSTTQLHFEDVDQSVSISAHCFGQGFVFPAMGLPSVEELLDMSKPYFTVER